MRSEIHSAINFLSNLLRGSKLTPHQLDEFRGQLTTALVTHFQDHWFPEKPARGSAYRCIRIVHKKMDRLLVIAGAQAGLTELELIDIFPREFTMWVDPDEVSYRIGEDGSVGIIYDGHETMTKTNNAKNAESNDSITQCGGSGQSCSKSVQPTMRFSPETVNMEYLATLVAS